MFFFYKLFATRLFSSVKYNDIGLLYLLFGFMACIMGTLVLILIRLELASPGNRFLFGNHQLYNVLVTSYTFIMIFFMFIPMLIEILNNVLVCIVPGRVESVFFKLGFLIFWFLPLFFVSFLLCIFKGGIEGNINLLVLNNTILFNIVSDELIYNSLSIMLLVFFFIIITTVFYCLQSILKLKLSTLFEFIFYSVKVFLEIFLTPFVIAWCYIKKKKKISFFFVSLLIVSYVLLDLGLTIFTVFADDTLITYENELFKIELRKEAIAKKLYHLSYLDGELSSVQIKVVEVFLTNLRYLVFVYLVANKIETFTFRKTYTEEELFKICGKLDPQLILSISRFVEEKFPEWKPGWIPSSDFLINPIKQEWMIDGPSLDGHRFYGPLLVIMLVTAIVLCFKFGLPILFAKINSRRNIDATGRANTTGSVEDNWEDNVATEPCAIKDSSVNNSSFIDKNIHPSLASLRDSLNVSRNSKDQDNPMDDPYSDLDWKHSSKSSLEQTLQNIKENQKSLRQPDCFKKPKHEEHLSDNNELSDEQLAVETFFSNEEEIVKNSLCNNSGTSANNVQQSSSSSAGSSSMSEPQYEEDLISHISRYFIKYLDARFPMSNDNPISSEMAPAISSERGSSMVSPVIYSDRGVHLATQNVISGSVASNTARLNAISESSSSISSTIPRSNTRVFWGSQLNPINRQIDLNLSSRLAKGSSVSQEDTIHVPPQKPSVFSKKTNAVFQKSKFDDVSSQENSSCFSSVSMADQQDEKDLISRDSQHFDANFSVSNNTRVSEMAPSFSSEVGSSMISSVTYSDQGVHIASQSNNMSSSVESNTTISNPEVRDSQFDQDLFNKWSAEFDNWFS